MSNIKILIACHKDTALLDSKILIPIQVGAAGSARRFEQMLSDDTGDQISAKNPMYCELTAQYWAWKNLEADYYGFFHYRRYLSFSEQKYREDRWGNVREDTFSDAIKEKYGLSDKQIEKVVTSYDLLISEEKNASENQIFRMILRMPVQDVSAFWRAGKLLLRCSDGRGRLSGSPRGGCHRDALSKLQRCAVGKPDCVHQPPDFAVPDDAVL